MPRIARIVAVGYPHHITARGNYQQEIFTSSADRQKYLSIIKKESNKYNLKILAYCLMPNHVHLVVIPDHEQSMGNVFKYSHMAYSKYYNEKKSLRGHLFGSRFFSCVMDEEYLLRCVRYVERNPVKAMMVHEPWDWHWSSARVHCGMEKKDYLKVNELFKVCEIDSNNWKDIIDEPNELKVEEEISQQTKRGSRSGSNER